MQIIKCENNEYKFLQRIYNIKGKSMWRISGEKRIIKKNGTKHRADVIKF